MWTIEAEGGDRDRNLYHLKVRRDTELHIMKDRDWAYHKLEASLHEDTYVRFKGQRGGIPRLASSFDSYCFMSQVFGQVPKKRGSQNKSARQRGAAGCWCPGRARRWSSPFILFPWLGTCLLPLTGWTQLPHQLCLYFFPDSLGQGRSSSSMLPAHHPSSTSTFITQRRVSH